MKNTVLRYGLISGAIMALYLIIMVVFIGQDCMQNPTYGMLMGYAGMLVAFSFILVGVKRHRDRVGEGKIKFGRALGIGLLIMLVGCFIYALAWIIYVYGFDPEWMDRYVQNEIDRIASSGESPEVIAQKQEEIHSMGEFMENPALLFLFTMTEPMPPGIICSFLAALLWKR